MAAKHARAEQIIDVFMIGVCRVSSDPDIKLAGFGEQCWFQRARIVAWFLIFCGLCGDSILVEWQMLIPQVGRALSPKAPCLGRLGEAAPPKTEVLRQIPMPDTLIGSFSRAGLGAVQVKLRARLEIVETDARRL
jgi:hypothetical protein